MMKYQAAKFYAWRHFDGSVEDYDISSALTMEIQQSCTKSMIFYEDCLALRLKMAGVFYLLCGSGGCLY